MNCFPFVDLLLHFLYLLFTVAHTGQRKYTYLKHSQKTEYTHRKLNTLTENATHSQKTHSLLAENTIHSQKTQYILRNENTCAENTMHSQK